MLACLCLLALCGGCAETAKPAPPKIVSGYADIDALVRSRPGWAGLTRYDDALARLDAAARSLPAAGRADAAPAFLPALRAGGPSSLPGGGGQSGAGLSATEASLVGSLADRRRMARAEQVRRQQELWRRDARRLFPLPARAAEIGMDLDVQLLEANIAALSRTLAHWDNSAPPSPKLTALRQTVARDRARLEALRAERTGTREAARAAYAAALREARQARIDYAAAQGAALSARLEAEDRRALGLRAERLDGERRALLRALAAPEPVAVPPAGEAGLIALPRGPGAAAALSAGSLRAARAGLLAQRGRWAQYLYDDTRAAALDAAAKNHWALTFGPARPGLRDLTADLKQALSQG